MKSSFLALKSLFVFGVCVAPIMDLHAQTDTPSASTTAKGQWSLRADGLWSEDPNYSVMLGVDYRRGKHKFQLSAGAGTEKNIASPAPTLYLAYRFFVFKAGQHFRQYLYVSARGTKYKSEREATYLHQVPSIPENYTITEIPCTITSHTGGVTTLAGYGTEFAMGQHFFLDASVGLGGAVGTYESKTELHNTIVANPAGNPKSSTFNLTSEIRFGLGYSF